MFCNPKMKEVEILTNSIKLSENDKIIRQTNPAFFSVAYGYQSSRRGVLATVLSGASAELYGSLQSSYGTGYDNGAAAKYCSDFNVGYHREI